MKESKVKHTKFNLWVWQNLPKCRDVVKTITASMDAKLSWREWIVLKIHLLSCDPCVNFLKQIKFIRGTLQEGGHKLVEGDSSVKLSENARARLKEALTSTGPEV